MQKIWSSDGGFNDLMNKSLEDKRKHLDLDPDIEIADDEIDDVLLRDVDMYHDDAIEEYNHNIKSMIERQTKDGILILVGKNGRWDGDRSVAQVTTPEELLGAIGDVDDIEIIENDDGNLCIEGNHHDGKNSFCLYTFSEDPERFIEQARELGMIDEYLKWYPEDEENVNDILLDMYRPEEIEDYIINWDKVPSVCEPIKNNGNTGETVTEEVDLDEVKADEKEAKGIKKELKEIKPLLDEYGYEYFTSMPFTNYDNDPISFEYNYPQMARIIKKFFKEMGLISPEDINNGDILDDEWDMDFDKHDFDTVIKVAEIISNKPGKNKQFEKVFKDGQDDGLSDEEILADRKRQDDLMAELEGDINDDYDESLKESDQNEELVDRQDYFKNIIPGSKGVEDAKERFNNDIQDCDYLIVKSDKSYDPEGVSSNFETTDIAFGGSKEEVEKKFEELKDNARKDIHQKLTEFEDGSIEIYYRNAIEKVHYMIVPNDKKNESLDDEKLLNRLYKGEEEQIKAAADEMEASYKDDEDLPGHKSINQAEIDKIAKKHGLKEGADGEEHNLGKALQDYAKDHGVFAVLIDCNKGPLDSVILKFDIDGDWKHEHLYFDKLAEDFAKENNLKVFKIDTHEVGDSQEDYFEAIHTVYLIKPENEEILNSMRGMFQSVEEKLNEDIEEPIDPEVDAEVEDDLGLDAASEDAEVKLEPKMEDQEVFDASVKVMDAYQKANKWLDSVKEFVYTDLSCVFFSSLIHELAHTMPGRFDKFGDILHTIDMKIPYPATEEIVEEPANIDEVFEMIFNLLDGIKDSLNGFIKVTDEKYHGMACSAEALLNDIEGEYPMLFRLQKEWQNANGDMVAFDKYVGQYNEHKDELLESLNESGENFLEPWDHEDDDNETVYLYSMDYDGTPESLEKIRKDLMDHHVYDDEDIKWVDNIIKRIEAGDKGVKEELTEDEKNDRDFFPPNWPGGSNYKE